MINRTARTTTPVGPDAVIHARLQSFVVHGPLTFGRERTEHNWPDPDPQRPETGLDPLTDDDLTTAYSVWTGILDRLPNLQSP